MKLLIVSGLSGSGKSVALHMLEDLGYYCIDNMPLGLLEAFVKQTLGTGDPRYDLVAVGIDARARADEIDGYDDCLQRLRSNDLEIQTLFLQAEHNVLLKRFSETRRKHPLTRYDIPLAEAIHRERKLLAPVAEQADLVIDTSRTSMHELREIIAARIHGESRTLSVLLKSFGFKHGVPGDADFVFDVRCLPNPHWEADLRALTGRDQPVRDYLESHEMVEGMFRDIRDFSDRWLPHFEASNRSYVTIAIGCTGGQHRSVYMVERLGEHLRQHEYIKLLIRHTELS